MGRKKTNKIYSFFSYNEESKKWECLEEGCRNKYVKGNHSGNLMRHFFTHHRHKHDEIIKMNSSNKENMPEQSCSNTAVVLEYCTKLVTIHGRPFNIVEDEAFRQLLQLIPGLDERAMQAINVKNIKENISKKAYEARREISNELKDKLVALKVDVASVKLRRFLGLNLQYISDGRIVLRNLSVIELHDRNTALYLKENVEYILARYGIDINQILTITTDNGANMLCMVENLNASAVQSLDLGEDYIDEINDEAPDGLDPIEIEVEENSEISRKITGIRCAAHCLQLAVKDACRDLQDFFDKCRRVIRSLRTPNMSLKLKDKKLPQAILDSPTRWDSTADMLENLQKLKTFCVADTSLNIEPGIWSTVETYLNALMPCRVLSKRLQNEQLTCGDFFIAWLKCRHCLAQQEDQLARQLGSAMIQRQAILFENTQFLGAIYMDPRVNSILTQQQKTSARTFLLDVYQRINKLSQPRSNSAQGTSRPSSQSSSHSDNTQSTQSNLFSDFLHQQFAVDSDRCHAANFETLETEITYKLVTFLTQPVLAPECNILQYWATKKICEPHLYHLAITVLATPPTSVSVERLFSSLKFILGNLRMKLNDFVLDDIMVVRNNHLYAK